MFNRSGYVNSRPGGIAVLQVVETGEVELRRGRGTALVDKLRRGTGLAQEGEARGKEAAAPRFVALRRTELRGEIVGPLASLTVLHTYGYNREACDQVLEALYRFPLPGDAAVTGVRVRFGEVEISTRLKPREKAEADYERALKEGRQAALLTRESPSVFTLRVAGIRPDEDVVVETDYVQLARPQARQVGWQLRVPLTTAPRYVREDELTGRHAQGQPLAVLRDPGHRFALDLQLRGADEAASLTHALDVTPDGASDEGCNDLRVRLKEGEVLPDRDFVLTWAPSQRGGSDRPTLQLHSHQEGDQRYVLALVAPPRAHEPGTGAAREIVLLVDHSGSMSGAKWEAADWTVNSFLGTLTEHDRFALGLFHTTTKWFDSEPVRATGENLRAAAEYLDANRDSGGTNLGVALEQALQLQRSPAEADVARHVLIVTDAQVSDEARLFRLAEREAERQDARRISVICIDAAPNSFLVNELAERGGGAAHFVTSDPDEGDVTTALEGVLADWAEPVLVDGRLEVNRRDVKASGRRVEHTAEGSAVDLGDLPRGRAVWVVGRVPVDADDDLTFWLMAGNGTVATERVDTSDTPAELPALKALFGARRLLALEHLIHARYSPEELAAQLARLGYDADALGIGSGSVYAENALKAAQDALTPLLIEESLRYGIACAETGFVAVREEAGARVKGTAFVANALPAGWSDGFLSPAAAHLQPAAAPGYPMDAELGLSMAAGAGVHKATRSVRVGEAAASGGREGTAVVFSGAPGLAGGEAVLFDSAREEKLADQAVLTEVKVGFDDGTPSSLDPDLELLIYVGDLAMPRAQMRLGDLIRVGGKRPLNLRRRAGQVVRVVLVDPNGAWASAAPSLMVELAWRGG